MSKDRYENWKRLHQAEGDLAYMLAVFGDTLAKREGYKDPSLTGMEAIYFYIIHKFHWFPKDVRSMSTDDIRFTLTEEMHGWTAPKSAR